MTARGNGAQHICQVLESRSVRHVFGLPGSQNAILFSEMRRSGVKPIVTTNEMSAGFAALGYAVGSQRTAVMAIIGGPGFTYAITPLQEARLDSVPILCLVFVRSGDQTKSFRLQQTDYASVAGSICKAVREVSSLDEFATAFDEANTLAESGEPGPVVLVVESTLLEAACELSVPSESQSRENDRPPLPCPSPVLAHDMDRLVNALANQRVLLYLGRGAAKHGGAIKQLAEQTGAAVLTTTSGRGVIDERHPRVLSSDLVPTALVNQFIADFDRVLALGVRFSENGSRGYGLKISKHQLIHIDASPNVLNANYDADMCLQADVGDVVTALNDALASTKATTNASEENELEAWNRRFSAGRDTTSEPTFQGIEPATAEQFFTTLQGIVPVDSILVTDSGSHQMLCRKHWTVCSTNGLLVPTNFQSMGFAIPAAIGLSLAEPQRKVVAVIGDGGLQMSGLQLLAAAERRLPITVFVFSDGYFGHIRNQQLQYDGAEAGTVLPTLDLAAFCDSIGATYFDGSSDLRAASEQAVAFGGLAIVEVLLDDASVVRRRRTKAKIKYVAKKSIFGAILNWFRR